MEPVLGTCIARACEDLSGGVRILDVQGQVGLRPDPGIEVGQRRDVTRKVTMVGLRDRSASESGAHHAIVIEHGDAVAPLKVNGPAPADGKGGVKKGTRVTFFASHDTFKNVTEFDFDKLEHRYRELAFLNSGVRILK